MFERIGIFNANDYLDFLKFVQSEKEAEDLSIKEGLYDLSNELTTAKLKDDIRKLIEKNYFYFYFLKFF
jgi:hypothetical protein